MGQILLYFFWAVISIVLYNAVTGDPARESKRKADQAKKDENRLKGHIEDEGKFGKLMTIIIWVGLVLGVLILTWRG